MGLLTKQSDEIRKNKWILERTNQMFLENIGSLTAQDAEEYPRFVERFRQKAGALSTFLNLSPFLGRNSPSTVRTSNQSMFYPSDEAGGCMMRPTPNLNSVPRQLRGSREFDREEISIIPVF